MCSQDFAEQNSLSCIFLDYRKSLFQIEDKGFSDRKDDGSRSELALGHVRLEVELELVVEQDGWGGVRKQSSLS